MSRAISCFALLALLVPTLASAAIEFDPPIPYSSQGGVYDVALADLDLDGDLDVVVSSYDGHAVEVRLNNGGGGFGPATVYPAGWSLFTLVRDLDGDGLPDLATANFQEHSITTRKNLGGGVFGPATIFGAFVNNPRCIAATDWNGDGDLELVVIGYDVDPVAAVLDRMGSGLEYTLLQSAPVGANPKWVTMGDLDGDGRVEIITANYSEASISVLETQWPAAPTRNDFSVGVNPSQVVVASLNGDALPDIATVNENATVSVRLGTGGGSLGSMVHCAVASSLSQGLAAADFDNDGDTDLVSSNYLSGDVTALSNLGNGSFINVGDFPGGGSPRGLAAGDVDGDGDIDLAVTNYVPPAGGGFSILLNTQAGSENRPQIDEIDPAAGAPGATVTIRGLRFSGATEVRFGTMSASFVVMSDTEIQATVPPDARTARVQVTTPLGIDTSPSIFIVRPVILGFTPHQAGIAWLVNVHGYNFTATSEVLVNGVAAAYTLQSDSYLNFTVPYGATTGPITVINAGGSAVSDTSLVIVLDGSAGTLNLSWDDCGAAGALEKNFVCDSNAGPAFDLIGSFTAPPGVSEYLGMSADLTIRASTGTLPDWWRHGSGQCRGTTGLLTTFDFVSTPSCFDFYRGQAAGGFLYEPGYSGPDRARLLIQAAVPFDLRGPLASYVETYAFRARLLRTKTVGTGSCTGCYVPMTITLNQIQLFQPVEIGYDPIISTPDLRNLVYWNTGTPSPGPVIESFSPTSGGSGTEVTVLGRRFTNATLVRFGSVPASFTVDSDTQLRTSVPTGAATSYIFVTTPGGTGSSSTQFVVPGGTVTDGINLSWNDCGVSGPANLGFACNTNAGAPFTLVASFAPPEGVTDLIGLEGIIQIREGNLGVLPDWWRHGAGECRGTGALATSADFTGGPYTCADYWSGQAAGGFLYEVGYSGPDRARLRVQYAIALGTEHPLPLSTEYYGFKVNIGRTKTVGTGNCTGCNQPVCIVLESIQLFQPPEHGYDPVLTNPIDRSFTSWQTTTPYCPAPTPTLASLVTAQAEPGLVRLSWHTEEITSARLERRSGTDQWRALERLRPDGSRRISYEDRDVLPGSTHDYRLAVDAGGREIYLGETSVTIPVAPKTLALARAVGVDARTVNVSFTLPRATTAKLELFDVSGRLRASRSLEGLAPGDHDVSFAAQQPLGPGVYFVRLAQDGERVSRRVSVTY